MIQRSLVVCVCQLSIPPNSHRCSTRRISLNLTPMVDYCTTIHSPCYAHSAYIQRAPISRVKQLLDVKTRCYPHLYSLSLPLVDVGPTTFLYSSIFPPNRLCMNSNTLSIINGHICPTLRIITMRF